LLLFTSSQEKQHHERRTDCNSKERQRYPSREQNQLSALDSSRKEVSPNYEEPVMAEAEPAVFMSAAPVAWEHRPPRVIKLSEQAEQKAFAMSKATIALDTCDVSIMISNLLHQVAIHQ
jgi:hypothetical protein